MSEESLPALSEQYTELKEHILSSAAEAAARLECINEKVSTIEKVGKVGLEGASLGGQQSPSLEEEKLRTEADAAILGSIALQVDPGFRHEGTRGIIGALSTNSPKPRLEESFQPSTSNGNGNGTSQERRRRGGMMEKSKKRAGEVVKTLIDNDGVIEGQGLVSAATILIGESGLTPNAWVSLKKNLSNLELISIEKVTPTAKRVRKISLNTQRAIELAEAGELPTELKDYIEEALQKSGREIEPIEPIAQQPAEAPKAGSEPKAGGSTTINQEQESTPLDEEAEDEPEDEIEAQLEALEPTTKRRTRRKDNFDKNINFLFVSAGGESYSKNWKASKFSKLKPDVKMLMAVGQVNRSSYSCFKTEEEKLAWVLLMVNKGQGEEELTPDDLSAMLEECIGKEYIVQNGHGPQITDEGVKYISTFKKLQKSI